MIKVDIGYRRDHIMNVKVAGHAGFDEYGSDIVCAAASTLVTATVNNILSLEETIDASYEDETLTIRVLEVSDVNQRLLKSMITMLEEIEYDYQENIIIKEG